MRELKNHLSAYLARVKSGEDVVVTQRGRPIARLTALDDDVDRLSALIRAGVVIASTARRSLPARRVRLVGNETVAGLVADQRR